MRRISLLAALMFALFSMAFASTALAADHKRITGEELQEMMLKKEPMVIVDVREPELFQKGHVPGSINIPYEGAHTRILKELSPKDSIVFVCHGGPMGDELSEILTKNGYSKVYNVKGGMRKWKGPIEK